MDIDSFNKAETAKWLHLPNAFTGDLVDELGCRDGVWRSRIPAGGSFQYYALDDVDILIVKKGDRYV